jgi:hypothetical protein
MQPSTPVTTSGLEGAIRAPISEVTCFLIDWEVSVSFFYLFLADVGSPLDGACFQQHVSGEVLDTGAL